MTRRIPSESNLFLKEIESNIKESNSKECTRTPDFESDATLSRFLVSLRLHFLQSTLSLFASRGGKVFSEMILLQLSFEEAILDRLPEESSYQSPTFIGQIFCIIEHSTRPNLKISPRPLDARQGTFSGAFAQEGAYVTSEKNKFAAQMRNSIFNFEFALHQSKSRINRCISRNTYQVPVTVPFNIKCMSAMCMQCTCERELLLLL